MRDSGDAPHARQPAGAGFYRGLIGSTLAAAILLAPPARSQPVRRAPFVEPPVLQSLNGVLEATLSLENGTATINGQVIQGVWTYRIGAGGVPNYPGPTLVVNPGDTIRLHYENNLDDSPPNSGADTPEDLHVHGLHVSPLGNSDNVLLKIFNGQANDFVIQIPPDHPMGLYWYHPHVHGFVDPSIYYGLCGMIAIGSPHGGAPELDGLPDRLMAIQYQTITDGALVLNVENDPSQVQFTVNGRVNPSITVPPGTSEIWNIANISDNGFVQVELNGTDGAPDVPLVIVAQDGNPYTAPVIQPPGQPLLIPTGARYNILAQFPAAGTYQLNTTEFCDGFNMWPNATLMTVNCTGPQIPMHVVPDELTPPFNQFRPLNTLPVDLTRPVVFDANFNVAPPAFLINGGQFPDNPVFQPRLNTVEEWEIVNLTGLDHPFHIHVNDFQLISVEAPVEPSQNVTTPTTWYQDIINLPQAEFDAAGNLVRPSRVVLRMNPLDFLGTYVYHCHRVDHEDLGMMALVKIIPEIPIYAVAENRGGSSVVGVFNGLTNGLTARFRAFNQNFPNGLRVAVGDINHDGIDDVVAAPGPGGPPRVRAFNGATGFRTLLYDQLVFDASFRGGVNIATGDINADGFDDIIAAPASRMQPVVVVISGADGQVLSEFMPYPPGFTRGVTVASDIIDDGGRYSIITGTTGGAPPEMKVFQIDWNHVGPGATGTACGCGTAPCHCASCSCGVHGEGLEGLPPIVELTRTNAYPSYFTGGLNLGTGAIDGQNGGFSSILVGPGDLAGRLATKTFVVQMDHQMGMVGHGHEGGGGLVLQEFATLLPYPRGLAGGVSASSVSTPFGAQLLTTPSSGGAPTLKRFQYDNSTRRFNPVAVFSATTPGFRGGVFVSGR